MEREARAKEVNIQLITLFKKVYQNSIDRQVTAQVTAVMPRATRAMPRVTPPLPTQPTRPHPILLTAPLLIALHLTAPPLTALHLTAPPLTVLHLTVPPLILPETIMEQAIRGLSR